jgi:hypothetical protein
VKTYKCDPNKNTECSKTFCYINGGDCCHTTNKEYEVTMENEIRFYLRNIKECMTVHSDDGDEFKPFVPTYLITAVKLPTGAIELAVNNQNIAEKIDYILEAYDDNMCLKSNPEIIMQNIMIV